MTWAVGIVLVLLLCFAGVLLYGAPYLPTMKRQINAALDLLDLAPGQRLLELGSGDGRMLLAAAKRGYEAVGYELNPVLFAISWWRLRKLPNARVIWGNYWVEKWPETDAIFYFGLQKLMHKLNKKVAQECNKPVKLVSFAFKLEDKKPAASKDSVYLYIFP